MVKSNRFKINKSIYNIFIATSVLATFILIFMQSQTDYYLAFLLPLTFCVINYFVKGIYDTFEGNKSKIIIMSLYYIRYVIYPVIFALSDDANLISNISNRDINMAIGLEIWELTAVSLFIYYRTFIKPYKTRHEIIITKFRNLPLMINLILIAITLIILFINPMFSNYFASFFEFDKINQLDVVSKSETSKLVGSQSISKTLFIFNLNIISITTPALVMNRLSIIKFRKLGIFISAFLMVFPMLFITESNMYAIIVELCLILCFYKFYPKEFKVLISVYLIGFVFILINLISKRVNSYSVMYGDTNLWNSVAKFFQSYFNGYTSIAGGFKLTGKYFSHLFYDIYFTVPFRNSIFGIVGDNRLVLAFNEDNKTICQILPCITQGYYYLSVFCVVIPIIITNVAIVAEEKLNRCTNIVQYVGFLLLMVYSSISIVLYNFTIWGANVLGIIIPILIIACLEKDKNKILFKGAN